MATLLNPFTWRLDRQAPSEVRQRGPSSCGTSFRTSCMVAISVAVLSSPVLAAGEFVDSRVEGFFRYCYYSDGGALTTDPGANCPVSNRGLGGQVDLQNTYPPGKLASEEIRGRWKYCHYYGGASLPIAPTDTCAPTNN